MQRNRFFADLSSANTHFDARAYRKAGHVAVAIKATEGVTYLNMMHASWSHAAHRQGLAVFHYLFCRYDQHEVPDAEINHFVRAIDPYWRHGDRLVLDLEVGTTRPEREIGAYVHRAHDLLVWHKGVSPVGYASPAWLQSTGALALPALRSWWLADWADMPQWPGGVERRWAWQRTNGREGPGPHQLRGVGRCDVSIMSHALLEALGGDRVRAAVS